MAMDSSYKPLHTIADLDEAAAGFRNKGLTTCRLGKDGADISCVISMSPSKPGTAEFNLAAANEVHPHYVNFTPRVHQVEFTLPDGRSLTEFLLSTASADARSKLSFSLMRTENDKSVVFLKWHEGELQRPVGSLVLDPRWWWRPKEFMQDFCGERIEPPSAQRELAMLEASLIFKGGSRLREPGAAAAATRPLTDADAPDELLAADAQSAQAVHLVKAAEDLSDLAN
ncbi:hypothetical protein [Rhodoligotrophos defluvii]|uniref:hypothetical protein n=1 Tax=Rhodoligotrophos defluvii TaxID=2561934 RepID=UPI0010C9AE5F|nr:hypothetical protein [Rhodoligotrophos defluvii]